MSLLVQPLSIPGSSASLCLSLLSSLQAVEQFLGDGSDVLIGRPYGSQTFCSQQLDRNSGGMIFVFNFN